jgi:hypothetical protein
LVRLGVRPDNTYLFIRGHHLLDNVVMAALDPVCTRLRREREKEIKALAEHAQQMDNELSNYIHSQIPIEQTLRNSMAYKSSDTYQLVRQQVERFLTLLPSREAEQGK